MRKSFSKTLESLEGGRQAGLHPGAQIVVLRNGDVLLDEVLGENQPDEPLTRDHLMPWLSCGKPVTAVAVLQLWEQGRLDLDEPVAKRIPEFSKYGKESVNVRDLLTHTGGFRDGDKIPEHFTWEQAIARVCDAPLEPDWIPGKSAAYQIHGSWFLLGELIRRVDGRSPEQYVQEAVFQPLGMDSSYMAMPEDRVDALESRIGRLYLTNGPRPELHPFLNRDRTWRNPRPGGSLRGPVRELAVFYQMLLNEGAYRGARILKPETVREMRKRHRENRFDLTFQHIIDWGLGVMLHSARYGRSTVPYGFGRHASEDTFGHGGMQSSCALVDPERNLVAVWVCNGMPGEPRHQLRAREINDRIYQDLQALPGPMSNASP